MKKSNYQSLTCGDCGLEFLIPKKQYSRHDSYNCPICLRKNIVTAEDLKPEKVFRVKPVVVERDL